MLQSPLRCRILPSGLNKAYIDECSSVMAFYTHKIDQEPLTAPEHVLEWRRGSYLWVYVKGVEYWSHYLFNELELISMARKKNGSQQQNRLDSYTFVRCELTAADKEAAKTWIDKNAKIMPSKVADLLASHHKVSLSYSPDNDCFIASATGKEDSNNPFKTLTSRHKDWSMALFSLLYKHEQMFEAGVWESEDAADDGWS